MRQEAGPSLPQIQTDFYTETADQYDEQFVHEGDCHSIALEFISALIDGYGYWSVLDVASGTGRALRHLQKRHDDLELRGVDPGARIIDQAERARGSRTDHRSGKRLRAAVRRRLL